MDHLDKLIIELCKYSNETPWIEFKHNNYNTTKIGEYISALAIKRPPRYGQKRLFEIKTVDKSQKKWYNIHALSIRRIRQRWRAT